jgi:hypothetical protein
MKRWFLTDFAVVGGSDPYWATKIQYGYSGLPFEFGMSQADPENGAPVLPWTLVLLAESAQSTVASDTDIPPLPLAGYSTLIGDLDSGEWSTFEAACSARSIDISSIASTDTFGDLVALIAAMLEPTFDLGDYPL